MASPSAALARLNSASAAASPDDCRAASFCAKVELMRARPSFFSARMAARSCFALFGVATWKRWRDIVC